MKEVTMALVERHSPSRRRFCLCCIGSATFAATGGWLSPAHRNMLIAIRETVALLKKQGRSLADTIAAKPTAAYDAKWGGFLIDPAFFTHLVYEGV